jgi:hypothetical protein
MRDNMEPILRVVRRRTVKDEITLYGGNAGAAGRPNAKKRRMARRKQRSPKPSATFPFGKVAAAVAVMLIAGLGGLEVSAAWRLTYSVGCLAAVLITVAGLAFDWRRSHVLAGASESDKLRALLKRLIAGFTVASAACLAVTVLLGVLAATSPPSLVPHYPWDVEYGDVDGSGKNRVYVIARADNTTNGMITFEEYSKAMLEPNPTSIAFLQNASIIEPLRDEVRRLASGGDNPNITSYPHSLEPATFNIPGPVVPRRDYDAFRSGDKIVYYDALVYEKLQPSGLRFRFEDCEIARMIPNMELIPGVGTVQLPRQLSETPCNKSGS